jgi:threonine dehydrogenase-like Zn-dependent dehydrogenase
MLTWLPDVLIAIYTFTHDVWMPFLAALSTVMGCAYLSGVMDPGRGDMRYVVLGIGMIGFGTLGMLSLLL